MAEEEVVNTDEKKGGKGKIIILIAIMLLLVAASVVGTMFALGAFSSDDNIDADLVEEQSEPASDPAIYYPIKPAIVVNYQDRGRQRYVQLSMTVMSRKQEAMDALELHMPLVKNRVNFIMSGESFEDLQTSEGKELLRQKILEAVQGILQEEIGDAGVEQVLFTNFVMQ